MDVFACAHCGAVLTSPVSQVAFPAHGRQTVWEELLPVLMEPGTYTVDPEPYGPPWRKPEPAEAEARGIFVPVEAISFGAPGRIILAPGDTHGMVLVFERCGGYCRGVDGRDGPNLACRQCGHLVATRLDDCSTWQEVCFEPGTVRRIQTDIPHCLPVDWALEELRGTAPIDLSDWQDPRWEAATGVALAHLVAASAGAPVALPHGLTEDVYGHALDLLLPSGPPTKTMALAGPGLPAPDADIALVPRHPRTGEAWQPPGEANVVPLAAKVWAQLAFYRVQPPFPVTGRLPDDVIRGDDPLPPRPRHLFSPDPKIFLHTLARLPAVRQPWLRKIYDHVRTHYRHRQFRMDWP